MNIDNLKKIELFNFLRKLHFKNKELLFFFCHVDNSWKY